MSQRECAGFNWPPLAVAAGEPVGVRPMTRFACLGNWSNRSDPSALGLMSAPESFQSRVVVVTQPASLACCASEDPVMLGVSSPPRVPSEADAVVHAASCATIGSLFRGFSASTPRFSASLARVVGHEPQPLPDVRGADARSRDTGRCEGVADSFHVSLNKIKPAVPNRCFNLLTKDDRRAALPNEVEPEGPKVPLVVEPTTHACHAERLARAGTRPDGSGIRPPPPGVKPGSTRRCRRRSGIG